MIYSSMINSVNESEALSLLENATDRFEYETISEAGAIILGEQEANWTKFMTAVGLSELSSVCEGEEVIYEGVRFQNFIKKAKEFFEKAKAKLAEITKSFIAKVDQFVKTDAGFVKKYESVLNKASLPKDFEFKGYTFPNLEKSKDYTKFGNTSTSIADSKAAKNIVANKDDYSREAAEKALCSGNEDSFAENLRVYFYGSKSKEPLNNINIKDQINILKTTKEMKKNAQTSYKKAVDTLNNIIKKLKEAEKKAIKTTEGDVVDNNAKTAATSTLLGYWKAYSNCMMQYHYKYMAAMGARNRQARAICAKVLVANNKKAYNDKFHKDTDTSEDSVSEGFVSTDAFLGAVEFF